MYVIIIQYSFFNCCEINFMCYIFTVADIFENILTAKKFHDLRYHYVIKK